MRLTPTPTGNSFFDPPPSDQSAATLILGGERLECHLVEVSLGGFSVTIPRSTAWTGEPVCRLLTHDSAYPVRIIKQESQYTGFLFTLQRIQEPAIDPVEHPGVTQHWIVNTSRCCAIGLIAAIAYCLVAAPGGNSHDARRMGSPGLANLWNWTWTSNKGTTRHGLGAFESELAALTSPHNQSSDDLFEMPAISVSMTSSDHGRRTFTPSGATNQQQQQTSSPSSSPLKSESDPQARAIAAATRQAQIKSSLLMARRGPSGPADSTTLPWLFSTLQPTPGTGPVYRMSDAARNDLTLFEAGLKSLPAKTANDATRSLSRALAATSSPPTSASQRASLPFESLPDVRLIRSDDAEIYFRPVSGSVEILRVVPRDSHEPDLARDTSPTSSLTPQSVNR